MGVFSKLKNIFYDDEYVDEEEEKLEKKETKPKVEEIKVKKEVEEVKEEKKAKPSIVLDDDTDEIDIKPIKTENTFSERELFKPERTFPFTEFEEEDEVKPRNNVLDMERTSRINNSIQKEVVNDTPRVFKPSPVISPIYGILDKDYTKEHIVKREEKEEIEEEVDTPKRSYDSVRRKAYGTLEDDLEDTMSSITVKEVSKSVDNISDDVEELENKTAKIENLINEIEKTTSISIGELEERAKDEMFEDTDEIEPIKDDDKTMTDNTLEHDLFNLIDSMYDDKED